MHDLYERQANQAAIELLAQGDRLRTEADDSPLTMDLIDDLATRYAISLQATARRIVEETKQDCALAISFRVRGSGRLMPHHLYCSQSFEQRFRWKQTGAANALVAQCVAASARSPLVEPLVLADIRGAATRIEVDTVTTPRAVLALFRAMPKTSAVREPTTPLA